jgi:hypothetical protein
MVCGRPRPRLRLLGLCEIDLEDGEIHRLVGRGRIPLQCEDFAAVSSDIVFWGDGRQGFGIQVCSCLDNFHHPLTAREHLSAFVRGVLNAELLRVTVDPVLGSEILVANDLVTTRLSEPW